MTTSLIVGLQWGDEGKGKVIDLLSGKTSHILRAQGGHNAGHTVIVGKEEYSFHMIPSGILYPHARCYIGGGTVIDPKNLIQEIEGLKKRGVSFDKRFFISKFAHLILPYHQLLDQCIETRKGKRAVGTTGRGIGPCYTDRASRIGLRIADLCSPKIFKEKLQAALDEKNTLLQAVYHKTPLDFEPIYHDYLSYAKALKPYISDVEQLIHQARAQREPVLIEGAQGALLDLGFGTYPFVTSSNTMGGGICAAAGVGPLHIDAVLGVMKAYTTRVGHGPFPTEFAENFIDHKQAREFGTTTGRKRKVGWFDAVLARFAIQMSGVSSIALTKLDILDPFKEIRICTSYMLDGKPLKSPPVLAEDLDRVKPVYETIPGWESSTKGIKSFNALPRNAQAYIEKLEQLCSAPIEIISLGPKRENTIIMNPLFVNKANESS